MRQPCWLTMVLPQFCRFVSYFASLTHTLLLLFFLWLQGFEMGEGGVALCSLVVFSSSGRPQWSVSSPHLRSAESQPCWLCWLPSFQDLRGRDRSLENFLVSWPGSLLRISLISIICHILFGTPVWSSVTVFHCKLRSGEYSHQLQAVFLTFHSSLLWKSFSIFERLLQYIVYSSPRSTINIWLDFLTCHMLIHLT